MLRNGRIEMGGSLESCGRGLRPHRRRLRRPTRRRSSPPSRSSPPLGSSREAGDEWPGVEWGYAEHAGVKLHGMTHPRARRGAGSARPGRRHGPRDVMGVGQDRVYLAAGPRGEEALKKAIDDSAAMARARRSSPARSSISLGQVLAAAEKVSRRQPAGRRDHRHAGRVARGGARGRPTAPGHHHRGDRERREGPLPRSRRACSRRSARSPPRPPPCSSKVGAGSEPEVPGGLCELGSTRALVATISRRARRFGGPFAVRSPSRVISLVLNVSPSLQRGARAPPVCSPAQPRNSPASRSPTWPAAVRHARLRLRRRR